MSMSAKPVPTYWSAMSFGARASIHSPIGSTISRSMNSGWSPSASCRNSLYTRIVSMCFVDCFLQGLAISHAIVLVTHNEVVPLWPESLEGVNAVAVDVGTEATAHATCSPRALLVDVGQCQPSVSDVCPHVFVSPYRQGQGARVLLAFCAKEVATALLDISERALITLMSQQSDVRVSSCLLAVVVGWQMLQPVAAAGTRLVGFIQQIHPSFGDTILVVASEKFAARLAIGVASDALYLVTHLLADKRESILGKDLLQCLARSHDVDVLSLGFQLPDESTDAWRLAAGHHEHALDSRDDHLDE